MANQLTQNDPQAGFIVVKNERLSDLASESIDLLYQPIIGCNATALIRLFWRYSNEQKVDYRQRSHYDLFSFLQFDFREFTECRIKLEGAGLLKTFVQPTDAKPIMLYQLVPPLTNRQFFNDDLLSLALLENIGEKMYHELADRLLIKPFPMEHASEITQDFLDSFQIDADQLTNQPNTIGNLKQEYDLNDTQKPTPNSQPQLAASDDFDFQLVLDSVAKSYVRIDQVKKNYNLILNEHRLYGIDELALARLIIQSTNIKNNVFDPEKLKILVNRMYQKAPVKQSVPPNQNANNDAETQNDDFSDQEKLLLKNVSQFPPLQFLQNLKHQLGGFPSSSENKMIEEMLNRNVMNTSVINMLVYHILVDMNKTQLYQDSFERIANEWVQKYHVKTTRDAMLAIKDYNRKKEASSNNGSRNFQGNGGYRRKQPMVKKPVPYWLRKDYQPDVKPISEESLKKGKEMLRKFREDN